MDLKSVQKPLKELYRNDPNSSRITLKARGGQTETPIACSVAIGRAMYPGPSAHVGVGGAGTGQLVQAICYWELCRPARKSPARWLPRPWEYRSNGLR